METLLIITACVMMLSCAALFTAGAVFFWQLFKKMED